MIEIPISDAESVADARRHLDRHLLAHRAVTLRASPAARRARSRLTSFEYAITPPSTTELEPGIAVSRAPSSPPVQLSATRNVETARLARVENDRTRDRLRPRRTHNARRARAAPRRRSRATSSASVGTRGPATLGAGRHPPGPGRYASDRPSMPDASAPSSSASFDSAMPVVRTVRDRTTTRRWSPRRRCQAWQQLVGEHAAHLARHAGQHRAPPAALVFEPDARAPCRGDS